MLFRSRTMAGQEALRRWSALSPPGMLCAALALLALALLATTIDQSLSRFCIAGELPGELRRLLTWSEAFAHGLGVLVIAGLIVTLDPDGKRKIGRILVTAFGSGLLADVVKLSVARVRPRHLDANLLGETFVGWLPIFFPPDGFGRFDHRAQSFPSAHSAVAMGLGLALAQAYPRGKWVFLLLSLLGAAQRVECGAHYLSDTLAGAALGCVMAACVGRARGTTPTAEA